MKNPIHVLRATVGFIRVIREPDRLGEVLRFVDEVIAAYPPLMAPIVDAFRGTAEGARALAERPRIGRISLDALEKLPPGTLGRAFAAHLRDNGLDPDALPTREARTDEEYINAHFYETHDVWHALTGFGADRASELGLQAFYLAQFPARIAAGILAMGFANMMLFEFEDRAPRMDAIARGWLLGHRARSVLGVDWKELWSTPLSEVRARFGIHPGGAAGVLDGLDQPAPARVAPSAAREAREAREAVAAAAPAN